MSILLKEKEVQPIPTAIESDAIPSPSRTILKIIYSSYDTIFFSYCLKLSIGKQYSEDDLVLKHFAAPLSDKAKAEADEEKSMDEWRNTFSRRASAANQIIKILKSLDFIENSEREKVIFSQELQDVLQSIDFDAQLSKEDTKSDRDALSNSFKH
ncbi:hypothetical protein VX159_03885 [Dechloromonas sp. ZY10]|uniref:hypothetical protein n=1 Tax=Dechloromonas aquae TaxID=2664436 RepID=UPI003527D196